MKPFNLEEAKTGKPLQTRGGLDARIICFNRNSHTGFFLVCLISESDGNERVVTYTNKGKYWIDGGNHPDDLFMKPEKKTMWANVYRGSSSPIIGTLYHTKDEALLAAQADLITQAEVTWEE